MAAMAPALTDASAHPSSFKLPISPSDSGHTGFEATPSNPTSPGLPNGHSGTGHTHINLDQGIQETVSEQDSLLHQLGKEAQSDIAQHKAKVRLFRSQSQPGRIAQNSRPASHGELNGGAVKEAVAFPVSTRAPGLTNGGVTGGYDITKMSHSASTGAHEKQQPSQTNAHTALTMPPETSSLSLPNSTDVTGSSSTATADSSEAEDDARTGQVDIHDHPPCELDSGSPQDLDISYDKIVSNLNNLQNTMGLMMDKGREFLLPEILTSDQVSEVANRRSNLAERAKQLVQRVRCLQAQQITTHSKQQLRNFVQEQRKTSDSKAAEADTASCPECKRNSLLNTPDPNVPSQRRNSASGDGTKEHLSRTCFHKRKSLPSRHNDVDTSAWVTVKLKSKQLQAKLKHVENWVDSDETESSSGGESCDEGDDTLPSYSQPRQKQKVPLHRRAAWKWAVERASIASRWTWLQAQVSDLEYRIRQQSDIYRQTRASKGVAILGEPSSPEELMKVRVMTSTKTNRKLSPIEAKIARLGGSQEMSPSNLSTLLTNVDQQSARLKRSLQNCVSPAASGLQMPPSATSTPTGAGGKAASSYQKPMNGIVGSSGTHRPPMFNSATTSPGMSNKHQGINTFPSSPSLTPTVPEETYCARTRPVWYFRKRKLIRTMNIHSFSRKIQKLSTVRCGCCPPLTPCVMCGGRFNHVEKPKEPDMAPLNERVAQLDYSFHPVLSFPQDIPLSIQFEGMLKSNDWQRKAPPSKQSPMKKKRRPSTPTESKDGQKPKRKYERKNKDKDKRRQSSGEDKSLKMLRKLAAQTMKDMRHSRGDGKILKRANSKPSSLQNTPKKLLKDEISRRCRTDIKKRRAAQLAIAALKKTRARSLSLPNIKDHFHHNNSMAGNAALPNAGGDNGQASHLSQSMPTASLQNFLKPRRPGGGSDQYDIDNIVIPYSMLASTRLEKLEYKEIMTPKWRKIPEEQLAIWRRNHLQEVNNHEEEYENLSDSEFTERHAKCEVTERQKFLTILANQTSHSNQRRGARRSRNNSQGNTPEPNSPDANLFDPTQPSSVNSSNAPSPLTTQEALSPSGVTSLGSSGGGGGSRSRTSSWEKRRSSSMSETNLENSLHGIFEEIGHIENPWCMRSFPLEESEADELGYEPEEVVEDKEEPVVQKPPSEPTPPPSNLLVNLKAEGGSSRSSPLGELLDESSGADEEDPNDPEWTVVSPDKQKSSIVLRLAKR